MFIPFIHLMSSKSIQFMYIFFILVMFVSLSLKKNYLYSIYVNNFYSSYDSQTIQFMYISFILFMFVGLSLKKLSSTLLLYI